ncbi:MAG: serine/threonine-protein kinase [Planctomycetota bacterium]
MARLKTQRPTRKRDDVRQFEDLQPWIESSDSCLGRVGHYELLRCIGRGGMGVVFEAHDQQLERTVAVKMMSPALLVDPSSSQRFLREARAAASINHPAVVSIYAVSQIRDLPYLAMEFVDGESLESRLSDTPALDIESTIDIAVQLAEGLAAAHEQDVIHRDVKPANVLIHKESGAVKLTDFGLAHSSSQHSLTQTGTLLGTPEYLAPEQINDEPVDHRCDLFSLGSLIYHMLAGKPPFIGHSVVATLNQVANAKSVPLAQIDPSIPSWISDLVEQLHAKDPRDRISSAKSVAAVLRSQDTSDIPISSNQARVGAHRFLWIGAVIAAFACVAIFGIEDPGIPDEACFEADTSEQLMEYLRRDDEYLYVRVVSDEPYVLGPLAFDGQHVQIVAGEDMRATITFQLDSGAPAIRCNDSRLEINGVRFQSSHAAYTASDKDNGFDGETFISCEDAELLLHNCEFEASSRPCIDLLRSDGELSGMLLRTESHAIAYEPNSTTDLTISSSTIIANTGIKLKEPTSGRLFIDNSTFESNLAFEVDFHAETSSQISIDANYNQFKCATLVRIVDVEPPVFQQLQKRVPDWLPFEWQGSNNEIPRVALESFSDQGELVDTIRREEWVGTSGRDQ